MSARRRRFSLPSPVDFGPAVMDDGSIVENPLFRPPPPSPPSMPLETTASTASHHHHQQQQQQMPQLQVIDSAMMTMPMPAEMCCPVCLDAFQTPVTLNCSHNVCHDHILDLAAASTPSGVLTHGPSGPLVVHCPKCRHETCFAQGLASVHVNNEMQALIGIMLGMMKMQGEQQTATVVRESSSSGGSKPPLRSAPAGTTSGAPPHEVGCDTDSSTRQRSGSRGKSVRFASDDGVDDELEDVRNSRNPTADVGPVKSVLKRPGGSQIVQQGADGHTPRSDAAPTAAQRSVRDLERQLQAQREKQREEREKQAQAKLDEFKRQRREEIERRQQLEAEEERRSAVPAGAHGLARSPPSAGESPSRMRLLMALRGARSSANEDEDAAEEDTRRRVQDWIMDDDVAQAPLEAGHAIVRGASSNDVASHLTQLRQFEDATREEALTASSKARKAEARIKHLFEPLKLKSPEERAAEAARKREEASRLLEEQMAQEALQCDAEVETRLWAVEREVLRAHDQELSRAQMADIAEQRARAQIAAFRRQQRGGSSGLAPPTKPTYTPKLHRLQKIGSQL